ncbi:MAG: hypothetical protein M9893_07720 [Pyrinomonadaceae bacterium]|nr:hypothetical protein [Pyrinomonadaceae bacterium]
MPGIGRSEAIFIAAMMVLILIMCVVAVYYFVKTYKREMREKEERLAKKRAENAVKQTANDDQ